MERGVKGDERTQKRGYGEMEAGGQIQSRAQLEDVKGCERVKTWKWAQLRNVDGCGIGSEEIRGRGSNRFLNDISCRRSLSVCARSVTNAVVG